MKEEAEAGNVKKAFPALDSGSSQDGIVQSTQADFFFPPVVAGSCPKGAEFVLVPQCGAVGAPESVEGPAFGTRPPPGRCGRSAAQTPGTVTGQEQDGIDPGTPLNGEDGRALVPALFFPQTQTAFHFAMSNFNLPALPEPGE